MRKNLLMTAAGVGLLVLAACSSNTASVPSDTTTGGSDSSVAVPVDSGTSSSMDSGMSSSTMDQSSSMPADTSSVPATDSSSSDSSQAATPQARVIQMQVSNFAFSPNVVSVHKGEKVVIRLTGVSGTHSFASRDLGINVPITEGQTTDVEIPTDTAGTFDFRCATPCGPGHGEMSGQIIVS